MSSDNVTWCCVEHVLMWKRMRIQIVVPLVLIVVLLHNISASAKDTVHLTASLDAVLLQSLPPRTCY